MSNKRAIMRRFFSLLVCLGTVHGLLGQQPTSEGALKDAEFVIKKERRLLLPEAARLFESVSASSFVTDPIKPLEYVLPDLFPEFDTLPRKAKILRAKPGIVAKPYGVYLQGGYGNLHTPFLEGFFSNRHHSKYAYGLHIGHLSAGKEAYFEETRNLIQLHGKLFTETLRLGGEIDYHRDGYQLCSPGNSTSAVPRRQTLQQFTVRNTLGNYIHGIFNYQVDASFHYLEDAYQARESQWGFNGRGDYTLNDALTLKTFTDLYLTKHGDTTAVQRNLWRLKPMLFFMLNGFDVQGGVNLVYQDDVSYASDALNVYPVLEVKYDRYKWLRPYVGISGDIQRNSLQGFLQENPLLAPQATLRHTNQRFLFFGGARGDVVEQVSWHTGFSVGNHKNLHCFVNNDQDPSRFDVQYDPSATLLNTFGELTHTNRAETLTTRLRGDYFHYTLQELPKPWHRPRYQLDLLSTYRLHDKLVFKGAMHWVGGIEVQNVMTKAPVMLDDVVDVDLGIDYWLSSRLSIFFNCQNLLARKNERHLHYPARGFHGMLGLTYAW
jgi:hypothetical protein